MTKKLIKKNPGENKPFVWECVRREGGMEIYRDWVSGWLDEWEGMCGCLCMCLGVWKQTCVHDNKNWEGRKLKISGIRRRNANLQATTIKIMIQKLHTRNNYSLHNGQKCKSQHIHTDI